MKLFSRIALAIVFLANSSFASAQTSLPAGISAYRSFRDAGTPTNVKVPTVLEVPFDNDFLERYEFAVLDQTTGAFQPSYFKQAWRAQLVPVVLITSSNAVNSESLMTDEDTKTFTQFDLPQQGIGLTQISLQTQKPITSTALTLLVDDFVALPKTIEIKALVGGAEQVVLARTNLFGNTVRFPRTTATRWDISLSYGQPLRITELRLAQENVTQQKTQGLRFLAQPGHNYRIFFDPDRTAYIPVGESGNLSSDTGVFRLPVNPTVAPNPDYKQSDQDGDGIFDKSDNCVSIANPQQEDVDANGRGDSCDDFDRDGALNLYDNCPDLPNSNQADTDGDKIGDVCDGQESRITERYSWLPWVGIGFAAVVLVGLFASLARSMRKGPPAVPPSVPPVPPSQV